MKHTWILSSRRQQSRKGDKTQSEIKWQAVTRASRMYRQVTPQAGLLEEGRGARLAQLGCRGMCSWACAPEAREEGGTASAAAAPGHLPSPQAAFLLYAAGACNILDVRAPPPTLPDGTQVCLQSPWPGSHSTFFCRQPYHTSEDYGVGSRAWSRSKHFTNSRVWCPGERAGSKRTWVRCLVACVCH